MQQEETHTALQACQHAEAKIGEARKLLLEVRPEAVSRCQIALQEVVEIMEELVTAGTFQANPPLSSALLGIRRSAHLLRLQIEYASNLCFGWMQLLSGAGYTDEGLPVLLTGEAAGEPARCSFEV